MATIRSVCTSNMTDEMTAILCRALEELPQNLGQLNIKLGKEGVGDSSPKKLDLKELHKISLPWLSVGLEEDGRIALKVMGVYDSDAWLGSAGLRLESDEGEWPVSYHGTDFQMAKLTAKQGSQLKKCQHPQCREGIYSTPNPDIAAQYAATFQHQGCTYQIMMQNRINAKKSIFHKEEEYYVTPNDDNIRMFHDDITGAEGHPPGFLVRAVQREIRHIRQESNPVQVHEIQGNDVGRERRVRVHHLAGSIGPAVLPVHVTDGLVVARRDSVDPRRMEVTVSLRSASVGESVLPRRLLQGYLVQGSVVGKRETPTGTDARDVAHCLGRG
ncbi:unnamed protein product [Darwinula stevensoni]|uniref:Uncharacterized protein n=1 Tax=Darwinula stevensoni TaxID=69355 RepID=A0A7R8XDT7_9CRUS|nr:unnamed protein product [Darwinula stevensoni]CAG0895105.1 unnamed protein product [Darwinula stevensoni]